MIFISKIKSSLKSKGGPLEKRQKDLSEKIQEFASKQKKKG